MIGHNVVKTMLTEKKEGRSEGVGSSDVHVPWGSMNCPTFSRLCCVCCWRVSCGSNYSREGERERERERENGQSRLFQQCSYEICLSCGMREGPWEETLAMIGALKLRRFF